MNPQLKAILIIVIAILLTVVINFIHPLGEKEMILAVIFYVLWKIISALV